MGYRDDFYVSSNIIGYTGNVDDCPTVYFKSGNEFGRITQRHPNAKNVGRNLVREAVDYYIDNTPFGNAREWYNNKGRVKYHHRSRNRFYWVYGDGVCRRELAKAIDRCRDIKPKYAKRIR